MQGIPCPISRHRVSSFVITSNGAVEKWLSLFEDPILGNSALDRLANASYQIVIEGHSYRQRLSPHRALSATIGSAPLPPGRQSPAAPSFARSVRADTRVWSM
ncbi:MAG: hypothetical protein F4X98_15730 [Gammaproteobacteria bacterium]|nr:hypothetical protein [Gammaproteobacteria bacterium]